MLVLGNMSSGMDICRELVGKLARPMPRDRTHDAATTATSTNAGYAESDEATTAWEAHRGILGHPAHPGGRVRQSILDFDAPPPIDYDPKDPESPEWARRIEVVHPIERIEAAQGGRGSGRIVLADGSVLDDVDVIIFATGFA